MVVMWRLLTSFGVAKLTKLTRGQTALVVTKWSVLPLFGAKTPLKHGPCPWPSPSRNADCQDGDNGKKVSRCI